MTPSDPPPTIPEGPWSDAELVRFVRAAAHGVVATVHADGGPHCAVVGLASTDDLTLVFDTIGSSRKGQNLRRDGRVAVTVWLGEVTLQLEGVADEPQGDALAAAQATYFEAFPDGRERLSWPDLTWFRITPTWVRLSDFGTEPPTIIERRLP